LKPHGLPTLKVRGMIDEPALNVVEQLTLRKLEYVRRLLASVDLPQSGIRSKVRERLVEAIERNLVSVSNLQALLNELDAWGDQRMRLGRIPVQALKEFRSANSIAKKAAKAKMAHLLPGQIALIPPLELAPMRISYEENAGQRLLKLVAAKTRKIMQPQKDIPDHVDEAHYPGVVFKPFKVETQKVIAFAEIDLNTGLSLVSTALLRQGQGYKAEFEEFFTVFSPFIALQDANPVPLFDAYHRIRRLPQTEVTLVSRQARTKVGGKINYRSHNSRADLRADPELARSQDVLRNAPGLHCNCFWEPVNGLEDRVHIHVFAPEGEVSILGQIREASARYVLRRILDVN